jgi:hypothetical protein
MPALSPSSSRRTAIDLAIAFVVGVAAYLASCAIVAPGAQPLGFGIEWQLMSERPFDFVGRFPHRWLGPLCAWALGQGGAGWIGFTRALTALLLVTIALVCRRRGASWLDASLVTIAVALIAPVQMYKEAWVGYTDPLCYTLLFWALLAARHPVLLWTLFLANLMNHELAVFLLPWLWFVRRRQDARWRLDVLGAAGALGAYAAFYLYVRATGSGQFTADYFASHPLFPGGSVVVIALALVHYLVAFGPVLAVLAWFVHAPDGRGERGHFGWVLLGIGAIFCIAFDWSRHANLLVVPLVIAAQRFLAAGHRVLFASVVTAGAIAMATPVLRPWAPKTWPTYLISDPALTSGVVIARETPGQLDVTFGPLSAALLRWLPAVWPALWPMLALLAVVWVAGALFARRGATAVARPAGPVTPATADRGA